MKVERITLSDVFYTLGIVILCITILLLAGMVVLYCLSILAGLVRWDPGFLRLVTTESLWTAVKAVFFAGVCGYGACFACSALVMGGDEESTE